MDGYCCTCEQTQGEILQFQAFLVNNLEKVAGVLDPHAPEDLERARGGEFAEDKGVSVSR